MKKIMFILAILAARVLAENGEVPTTKIDYTDGTVTYIGTALTKASDVNVLPSTNSAIWQITKLTYTDGKVTDIAYAVTTNRGDVSLRRNVWADRASTNTIYKTSE